MTWKSLFLFVLCLFLTHETFAVNATGGPGVTPRWSSAKKVQAATSQTWNQSSHKSLVWFTNAQGVLTETYFPNIDQAQIKDSQFMVTDGKSFFVDERLQMKHEVRVVHPSLVQLINRDHQNRFAIKHTFFVDQQQSILYDQVEIETKVPGLEFYLIVNPHLNNTGFADNARTTDKGLKFEEGQTTLFIDSDKIPLKKTVGYVGVNDGHTDLRRDFKLDKIHTQALSGNVAGTLLMASLAKAGKTAFTIRYSFEGQLPSLVKIDEKRTAYLKSWDQYLNSIKTPKGLNKNEMDLFNRSVFTLKVHEDKLNAGAMIASLSKPWGEDLLEYPGVFTGGYHLVWPRDLYHVCAALISIDDRQAPLRALRFLKRIQYQSGSWNYNGRVLQRRGAWPQNAWADGREYWGGHQIDQVGYPIQLFYHLYKTSHPKQKMALIKEFGQMIRLGLEHIQQYGPWSGQERWEENYGISPSSFSVAATALLVGSKIFPDAPQYQATAKAWLEKPGDNIHTWTFTKTGVYGNGQYYLRVAGCSGELANWNPNSDEICTIANSGQRVQMKEILDQGFLKLALMGLIPADDWKIKTSLAKINKHIRVKTPHGYGWYRYRFDAYGENKKGRLWPLLSSEHGRYAIERYRAGEYDWQAAMGTIGPVVKSYLGFANEGQLLPEQVWEHNGEGTGAATPLAWSHAEYIKMIWGRNTRRNIENLFVE